MLESEIESEVCKYAESKGFLTYKFSSPSNRGVPDRIFVHNNLIFFIEFKTPTGKLSALQIRQAEKLHNKGFPTYVVRSIEDGKTIIDAKICK